MSIALPPSQRDFQIYEAIHIAGCSTRSQADLHEISQTRVRQIVCRVVEWLSTVIPPQAKVAKEQEIHLARQIAASRFQHQYEQMTTFWDMTRESKYAGLRMRITTAQARLGAVTGLLDGLAADAIEGIPVPAWQPPADQNPKSKIENPKSKPATADRSQQPNRLATDQYPPSWDVFSYDELTPEIVAAFAAYGRPLHPNFIEYAKQHGSKWPRPDTEHKPEAQARGPIPERTDVATDPRSTKSAICNLQSEVSSPPPNEDCSPKNESPDAATQPIAENPSQPSTYDTPSEAAAEPAVPCSPLLTLPSPQPVTTLHITPDQPGITLTPPASSTPQHHTTSSLPITIPSS